MEFLFQPSRYKVAYGGRAGVKSWSFARALLILAATKKLKILCAREYQASIKDSVYALLKEQIRLLQYEGVYKVLQSEIRGKNGTEFIFRGMKNNPEEIKSTEGVDIVWVEEAQKVSNESWEVLIPTIRKEGSEIWVSFNPRHESDPTYQRMVKTPPPGAVVVNSSWRDNPWLSPELEAEKDFLKETDPESYEYIWEGGFEVVRQGAYYHKLLMDAQREGRVCSVPYDPAVPVDTSWDIGVDDETCIWFWQAIPGGEYHLIDFLHGSDEGIEYYLEELNRRKYVYGKDYVPHDFKARSFAAGGRSAYQIAKNHGRKMVVVPRMNPLDRIQPTRTLLPRCYFDKAKTDAGLESLRNYRREYDDDRKTYKSTPLHDWASHGADAFGHYAVAYSGRKVVSADVEEPPPMEHADNAWMGM